MGKRAVLFATVSGEDGRAAATIPVRTEAPGEVISQLVDQLSAIGIDAVTVLTRPPWVGDCARATAAARVPVTVVPSSDLSGDLAAVAGLADAAPGGLVLAAADLVISGGALAKMLAHPGITSGALVRSPAGLDRWAAPVRDDGGRVVSAGSGFHAVRGANAVLAGVLMIAAETAPLAARAARELAMLATPPWPPSWQQHWSAAARAYAERAYRELANAEPPYAQRAYLAEATSDVVALILVGLVRANVPISAVDFSGYFLSRPNSAAAARAAQRAAAGVDEDRVRLDAAVKTADSPFTTFFVSPYSRYLARWAAHRGWTPNGITFLSLGIGLLAAGTFATGSRRGLLGGAVLLQAAFTADCVDGQLARYTGTFSSSGAWLDAVFDRVKEYAVYAGLAIGSVRGFGKDVWALALSALALQTFRHTVDVCYAEAPYPPPGETQHRPLDAAEDSLPLPPKPRPGARAAGTPRLIGRFGTPGRRGWVRHAKRVLILPIGERFALISLTSALGSPRTTFRALLTWGSLATMYSLTGKLLRSVTQ